MTPVRRVILIVLDSVGIGALPDAAHYNDSGADTLGHIAQHFPDLQLPRLCTLGLGNIVPDNGLCFVERPTGAFGKAAERSAGKDTTTGHWEIAGAPLPQPFPVFEQGFPQQFIHLFEEKIGVKTLGNYAASGTAIIDELGDEHVRTGFPIVYTSADSVFQIAMHESVFPIERQYEICQIARDLLRGEWEVGRVIARPFTGESGRYTRTARRKDFSVSPPYTVLDAIQEHGRAVLGIGKIYDIFNGKGINRSVKTANNQEGIDATIEAISSAEEALIFTNLVDFDMYFGHRRDVPGYAKALMEFDARLPEIFDAMRPDDLLVITADHGNDPVHHGTDHTREYIPILHFGKAVHPGVSIGTRNSFSDIAASIAAALNIPYRGAGQSYWPDIFKP